MPHDEDDEDDDFREEIRRRLAGLRLAPTRETEIVEELTQHVETRYAELVSRGHTEDEARRQALEELDGHGLLATELARAVRPAPVMPTLGETHRGSWPEQTWQDVRFGARMLARHRGYTLVAALTLALGIGANTAIFTLVNAVLLRPLPFSEADRLYNVYEANPARGWDTFSVSHPNYLDWRRMNHSFTDLAAWGSGSFAVASGGDVEVVPGLAITDSFLPVLGLAPAVGRNFLPEEDRPGGANVALLGHSLWQRRFGGDPSAIGRTVTLDDEPHTIVGVLPASFNWAQAEVFVPYAPDPTRGRSDHRMRVLGRLRPGVTAEQAVADTTTMADQLAQSYPDSNKGWTVRLQRFYDAVVPEGARQMLLLLLAAAGFVLLIAASNVANLTLARASSRRRELALRVALGAGRGRIVRQLLTEALLLALFAGVVGVGVALAGTELLRAHAPRLPRMDEISIDARVIGFALIVSTLTGILFGLIPAIQASRLDLNSALQQGGRTGGGVRKVLRSLLVVAEVALSVALLAGAGLLLRSFWTLSSVSPGFEPNHLVTMRLDLSTVRYPGPADALGLYRRVLTDLRALPGTADVATTSIVPLGGGNTASTLVIEGRPPPPDGSAPSAAWRIVSAGYFRTLGIPLRGRDFDERDGMDAPPVTIISEEAARRFWPGEDPIGKRLVIQSFQKQSATIIGVAGDVRSLGLEAEPGPMVYGSLLAYSGWRPMHLLVRTQIDPAAQISSIRAAMRSIDPALPLSNVRTADEILSESLGPRRFNMFLLATFAAVALGLACVGLFGVLGYLVTQRTREIGVRMALGAPPGRIFRLIVGEGMLLAGIGAAVGLALALALTRVMASLLYRVEPTDPVAFAAAVAVLVGVAVLACYLPARRAMRTDPMTALRYE